MHCCLVGRSVPGRSTGRLEAEMLLKIQVVLLAGPVSCRPDENRNVWTWRVVAAMQGEMPRFENSL